MKIALFSPSWPPGSAANGIVTYLSHVVPTFRRLGHDVYVLTYDKKDEGDSFTIDLRRYKWRFRDRMLYRVVPELADFYGTSSSVAAAVAEFVEKKHFDVLEMEESFGHSLGIARLNLLPVIVRLHGPWFLNGRFNDPGETTSWYNWREAREGRAIEHAHFVTAPSAEVLQSVKEHYQLNLPASRVIHYPVHSEEEPWKLSNVRNFSILFVGRFDKRKGGDFVLRVFAELAASYPQLKLTFAGPNKGFKEPNGNVLSFEEFVQHKLPKFCRSRIEFLGQMNQYELAALRKQHFLTIVASQYETTGYTVLEAMAVGSPLVATAVGGIPEIIQDQRNGLLIPSQNVSAAVAACKKLLDDQTLAARLGRQAWLDCRELYNPENIAAQTLATYTDAIDNFKRAIG